MVKIFYKNLKSSRLKEIPSFRAGSWIHAEAPSEPELAALVTAYGLDEGHLRDAVDLDEVPRSEIEGDQTYIFTRYAYQAGPNIQTAPFLVMVGKDLVLTVTPKALPGLDKLTQPKSDIITTQKSKLLLQILLQSAATYDVLMLNIERQIRRARTKLSVATISNKDLVQFVTLEDVLNDFLSELIPMSVILNSLLAGKKNLTFYEEDKDLIEDLALANRQTIETGKANLRTIANIRESYSTIMTNNLNRQIKLLTSLTIILMVPNILSGFFGMNVPLPVAEGLQSFWLVVGVAVGISGLLFWVFRRKDWL